VWGKEAALRASNPVPLRGTKNSPRWAIHLHHSADLMQPAHDRREMLRVGNKNTEVNDRKAVGGRLIGGMANALAAEGWMPVFLCSPERVHFYTRLGFEKMGEYARYEVQ